MGREGILVAFGYYARDRGVEKARKNLDTLAIFSCRTTTLLQYNTLAISFGFLMTLCESAHLHKTDQFNSHHDQP